jgi:hypothetical protein
VKIFGKIPANRQQAVATLFLGTASCLAINCNCKKRSKNLKSNGQSIYLIHFHFRFTRRIDHTKRRLSSCLQIKIGPKVCLYIHLLTSLEGVVISRKRIHVVFKPASMGPFHSTNASVSSKLSVSFWKFLNYFNSCVFACSKIRGVYHKHPFYFLWRWMVFLFTNKYFLWFCFLLCNCIAH